jgi:uncharacterized membrane protein YeaQ/YmgE (transglycosylase-associated protein family)
MGLSGWLLIFAVAAGLATVAQYVFFRHSRGPNDLDWVYIASGAVLGGFTANVWYGVPLQIDPELDGWYMLPALAGAVILATLAELVYRAFIRPRQSAR